MNAEDRQLVKGFRHELQSYGSNVQPLPGISTSPALDTFVFQIIESVRRIRYVKAVAARPISPLRADPKSELFDPIRAAILECRKGNLDEAAWLIFLFTHFGKNLKSRYQLLRDVYGRLGQKGRWDWKTIVNDAFGFRQWLDKNILALKSDNKNHRAFGNHRKYQSLDVWKKNGTGAAVESYVAWVKSAGGHQKLFSNALALADGDGPRAFRNLYRQMDVVASFGRTAKFDYLAMIAKVGISQIEPDSVSFQGATGPIIGARLLFGGAGDSPISVKELEQSANALANVLGISKQAMEDSLCNWQKSPTEPIRFRG